MQQPSKHEARASARKFWFFCVVLAVSAVWGFAWADQLLWSGDRTNRFLVVASFGLVALSAPVGALVRMQVFKRHWVGQAVTPMGFVRGTRVFLLVELTGIVAAGGLMLFARPPVSVFWGYGLVALLVLAVGYPRGIPMNTRLPEFSISHSKRL
ncbi:hypothetical protein [Mucisphaera calidilacus]|uniref:Uncharacterized protein n=1 Tax=Mucisphaera calidilacus TaxID=2527982 RepID=A0A518BY87_9BACT|nr:hypothetical protein [Mucisphaera calidilacus]QDU71932.1 hypothetical protein Pan265_17910 [Mucisphaera calidilacus]